MRTLSFVMALAVLGISTAAPAQPVPPFPAAPAAEQAPCRGGDQAFAQDAEALIVAGIDAERAKFAPGAPPLMPDPDLERIAQIRSCEMARGERDFSHEDGEGRFIAEDMVRARFGPYGAIGENIMKMGAVFAVGTRPFAPDEFARDAVAGWMKSPGHRENILDPRFNMSGIGVAMVGDQAFATQVFWGPPRIVRKRQSP